MTDHATDAEVPGRFSVEPARAERMIAGHKYRVVFWTMEQWIRLPDEERPVEAQPVGGVGFLDLTPD